MKEKDKKAELEKVNQELSTKVAPRGFEEDDAEDIIIPRIKLVQDLSPERKEKIASEGDLINSLTKETLNSKPFIPVFKFDTNIMWKDRSLGGGIQCMARDGKTGTSVDADATCTVCKLCGLNKFDNTKKGKDAAPLCTAYINFFGFVQGEHIPIILSFCKTYYNEGRKMYSMAKFKMTDMWNFMYNIGTKQMSKNDNTWYIITVAPGLKTSDEDKKYAEELYTMFKENKADFKADLEETSSNSEGEPSSINVDKDMASEI